MASLPSKLTIAEFQSRFEQREGAYEFVSIPVDRIWSALDGQIQ